YRARCCRRWSSRPHNASKDQSLSPARHERRSQEVPVLRQAAIAALSLGALVLTWCPREQEPNYPPPGYGQPGYGQPGYEQPPPQPGYPQPGYTPPPQPGYTPPPQPGYTPPPQPGYTPPPPPGQP